METLREVSPSSITSLVYHSKTNLKNIVTSRFIHGNFFVTVTLHELFTIIGVQILLSMTKL